MRGRNRYGQKLSKKTYRVVLGYENTYALFFLLWQGGEYDFLGEAFHMHKIYIFEYDMSIICIYIEDIP